MVPAELLSPLPVGNPFTLLVASQGHAEKKAAGAGQERLGWRTMRLPPRRAMTGNTAAPVLRAERILAWTEVPGP